MHYEGCRWQSFLFEKIMANGISMSKQKFNPIQFLEAAECLL
jgi:hypothetical protein